MIVGRENELGLLKEAYESNTSSFIAVYGRRRIEKHSWLEKLLITNFSFLILG